MTHFVDTDLSVDTVVLAWHTDYWFDCHQWKHNKPTKPETPLIFYKKVCDVGIIYMPQCHLLFASFSASGMVNGHNCFLYRNNQYEDLKQKVETAVKEAVGREFLFENAIISRLDVYKTIQFPELSDAKNFIKWMQSHPCIGRTKKLIYSDNGDFRYFRSGLVCKAYIKNEDPAVPDHIKKILPPTVRLEVGCRKKQRRNLLGKNVSADILKYPDRWQQFFNSTLKKFFLDGIILSKAEYRTVATNILRNEYPHAKATTLERRLDLLLNITKRRTSDRRKWIPLVKRVAKYGILPFHFSKVNLIPNHTLCGYASMTVEEQLFHERNQIVLERTLELFRYCLNHNRQGANTACIIFSLNSYLLVTSQLIILAVAIDDSS